jgi:hypothetical protein
LLVRWSGYCYEFDERRCLGVAVGSSSWLHSVVQPSLRGSWHRSAEHRAVLPSNGSLRSDVHVTKAARRAHGVFSRAPPARVAAELRSAHSPFASWRSLRATFCSPPQGGGDRGTHSGRLAALVFRAPTRLARGNSARPSLRSRRFLAGFTRSNSRGTPFRVLAVRFAVLVVLEPRLARTLPVRQRVRRSVPALRGSTTRFEGFASLTPRSARNATNLTPLAARAPAPGARGWFLLYVASRSRPRGALEGASETCDVGVDGLDDGRI